MPSSAAGTACPNCSLYLQCSHQHPVPKPTLCNLRDLKCTVIKAQQHIQASLAVLQVRSSLCCTELEQRNRALTKGGQEEVEWQQKSVVAIIDDHEGEAECILVAKGSPRPQTSRGWQEDEEEEEMQCHLLLKSLTATRHFRMATKGFWHHQIPLLCLHCLRSTMHLMMVALSAPSMMTTRILLAS